MPTLILYAGEIKPAKSVLGMFNGSESFVISNRFFQTESMYDPNKDDITKRKENDSGFRLSSPHIYWKDPKTGAFVKGCCIAWNEKEHERKKYYAMKPSAQAWAGKCWDKQIMKVLISPNDKDNKIQNSEKNLLLIDYQFSIGMQVLLFANVFGIDLSKYGSGEMANDAFFAKFAEDIDGVCKDLGVSPKEPLIFEEAMIKSFTNAPYFGKHQKIYVPAESQGEDEPIMPAFKTIWDSVADSYKSQLSKKPLKSKCPPALTKILADPTYLPCPNFKLTIGPNKKEDGKWKNFFDAKLRFTIKFPEKDANFNPNITMYSRYQVSKDKIDPINRKFMARLWGGKENAPYPKDKIGALHEGFIFMRPNIDFQYYATGQPTITWAVDKIAIKDIKISTVEYADGNDCFQSDSDSDDSDEEVGRSGAKLAADDDDDGYRSMEDDI